MAREVEFEIQSVSGHIRVERNEEANSAAKETAGKHRSKKGSRMVHLTGTHQPNYNRKEIGGDQALVQDKVRCKTTHLPSTVQPRPSNPESRQGGPTGEGPQGSDLLPAEVGTYGNGYLPPTDGRR